MRQLLLKVYPTRLELFRKIFYPTRLFWVSSTTCLDLIQSLKYVSKFVKTMWSISSNRFTDKLLSMLSFSQLEIAKKLWETSCGRTCLWSRLFWAFENTISNFSWNIICKKIYRTVNHQWKYVHIIWFFNQFIRSKNPILKLKILKKNHENQIVYFKRERFSFNKNKVKSALWFTNKNVQRRSKQKANLVNSGLVGWHVMNRVFEKNKFTKIGEVSISLENAFKQT